MTDVRNAIAHAVTDAVIDAARDPRTDTTAADAGIVSAAVVKEVGPILEHATNNEPFYQSRVMIGSIGTIVTSVFGIIALYSAGVTDGELYAAPISGIIGASFAIYGRLLATKPLGQ